METAVLHPEAQLQCTRVEAELSDGEFTSVAQLAEQQAEAEWRVKQWQLEVGVYDLPGWRGQQQTEMIRTGTWPPHQEIRAREELRKAKAALEEIRTRLSQLNPEPTAA